MDNFASSPENNPSLVIEPVVTRKPAISSIHTRASSSVPPWFCWPSRRTVHLVTNNIHIGDAIGNFILYLQGLLQRHRVPCALYYTDVCSPELVGQVHPVADLYQALRPNDVLVVNFSIYMPELEALSQLDCYKAVIFYGITPPRFLQMYQPELAECCLKGYQQGALLNNFDQYAAISQSAAKALQKIVQRPLSLEDIHLIPPLVDFSQWNTTEAEPIPGLTCDRFLLYVGRVVPHKRIEDLIELFAAYSKLDPEAHLVVSGSTDFAVYKNYLDQIIAKDYASLHDKIHFLGMVPDGQLKMAYQSAAALVMMSEHEGFCVPLVEAMHFGLPVFAYGQEAIRETLGRSGKVFYEKDFERIAEDIHTALVDPKQRAYLLDLQGKRLRAMQDSANGSAIWQFLEAPLMVEEEYPL